MSHRSIGTVRLFALGFLLATAGSAALAAAHHGSPGYEWGRANCGPATGNRRTYASCVSCCMNGAQNEAYPPDDAEGCGHFCKRVPWPIWMS